MKSLLRLRRKKEAYSLGAPPGIEHIIELSAPPKPQSIQYELIEFGEGTHAISTLEDLSKFLAEPESINAPFRWLNIVGLHPHVVAELQEVYKIHPLIAEDIVSPNQRSKVEEYDDCVFCQIKMLRLQNEQVFTEQVSILLLGNTMITFQEYAGDVWDNVRKRIQTKSSRFQSRGTIYLFYALIDAIVDHLFPVIDAYQLLIEQLENDLSQNPDQAHQKKIHQLRKEIVILIRLLWSTRDIINQLLRIDTTHIPKSIRPYFKDVYDHCIQVIDTLELSKEEVNNLHDLYTSSVSNRMNEVMKVLTLLTSLFVPATFLAGIYGMNFQHMPELGWKYSYIIFWGMCIAMITGMLLFFRRKRWF